MTTFTPNIGSEPTTPTWSESLGLGNSDIAAFTAGGQRDAGWDRLIDYLLSLKSNPSKVDDGLVTPPNHSAIHSALNIVQWLRDDVLGNRPHRFRAWANTVVSPEPSGGIIIEVSGQRRSWVFTLPNEGRAEVDIFEGNKLLHTEAL